MKGVDRDNLVVISVTRTGLAVVLAMLMTIMGFMPMATTLISELTIFKVVISLGLIIVYTFSIMFLLVILKKRKQPK